MTDTNQNEAGVLAVLVQRLETQRLPRALEIKDRLDRGDRLTDAAVRRRDGECDRCGQYHPHGQGFSSLPQTHGA